jgi:hypothetical protein
MPGNDGATARGLNVVENCAKKCAGKKGFIKKSMKERGEASPDKTSEVLRSGREEGAVDR